MTALSVLVHSAPTRVEQLLPYAGLVQSGPAHRLWQGQSSGIDPWTMFAAAAGAGFRVPVGVGVALTPLHHPYAAALQARSLAACTGHDVVAGLGPGAPSTQAGFGSAYPSPLRACREYLTTVRGLLDGQQVSVDGADFTTHAALPPLLSPRVQVGLGVLRPRMAELAGEVADVAITWLTPPSYLAEVILPAIRRGAERLDRPAPRVTVMVPMAQQTPERDPVGTLWKVTAGHALLPHYRDMLRQAGLTLDPEDPRACTDALLESRTMLYGRPDDLRAGIRLYREAGADEVVINTAGVGLTEGARAAFEETHSLLEALT